MRAVDLIPEGQTRGIIVPEIRSSRTNLDDCTSSQEFPVSALFLLFIESGDVRNWNWNRKLLQFHVGYTTVRDSWSFP